MRRCYFLFICPLALSLLGGVRADPGPFPDDQAAPVIPVPVPPEPMPPAPRLTFAQALAAIAPPKLDLFLTVGAEDVPLPQDEAPSSPDDRAGQVAEAYERQVRPCGAVIALGPPTMTILTANPGVPSPYEGVPASDALKLLLGSLSAAQWQALTSENGLGLSDLFEGSQTDYFRAFFVQDELTVNPPYGIAPITLKATDLLAARLRLGTQTQIVIPIAGGKDTFTDAYASPIPGQTRYESYDSGAPAPADMLYGVTVRQTVTNNPKPSDLDWKADVLNPAVSLDGMKTVGDVIARIGAVTGLELYADRRFEKRSVTLLGRSSARAGDLLYALAFCVTGTYRNLGSAYVLTDDVQGLSARRQVLQRFVQRAALARRTSVAAAENRLVAEGGVDGLPALDGLELSASQLALARQQNGYADQIIGRGSSVNVPFAQLTPAQQDYVRGRMQQNASTVTPLTLGGQFRLSSSPVLLLLSPAVSGPVVLVSPGMTLLYTPSFARRQELESKQAALTAQNPATSALQPGPSPLMQLAQFPRRAVIARPRTASEVDSVIKAMQALGLNQLWLDVFYEGKLHCDLPQDGTPDILTEALMRTKGTGIAVMPALDLLKWGADAPLETRDLTASGETYAQANTWQQHYDNRVWQGMTDEEDAKHPPFTRNWACPILPATEKILTGAVRRLAATPGVAVLVLRGTSGPGYDHPPGVIGDFTNGIEVGYTPAMRLAFLRRDHVDPVDLPYVARDINEPNGSLLPGFDDGAAAETGITEAKSDWDQFRFEANRELMKRLLAAGREAGGPQVRFLVREVGYPMQTWYGLWDDPRGPLPFIPPPPSVPTSILPWEINFAPAAHSQCRIDMWQVNGWGRWSLAMLQYQFQQTKPGWDGVVLDLLATNGFFGENASAANPIADLAREAAGIGKQFGEAAPAGR